MLRTLKKLFNLIFRGESFYAERSYLCHHRPSALHRSRQTHRWTANSIKEPQLSQFYYSTSWVSTVCSKIAPVRGRSTMKWRNLITEINRKRTLFIPPPIHRSPLSPPSLKSNRRRFDKLAIRLPMGYLRKHTQVLAASFSHCTRSLKLNSFNKHFLSSGKNHGDDFSVSTRVSREIFFIIDIPASDNNGKVIYIHWF